MKIEHIKIENFKSIHSQKIYLDGLTMFVGPNGCGKSNFLKALKFFYDPKIKSTIDDYFNRDTSLPIEIEILYNGLTETEKTHFGKYVSADNKLCVIKRFKAVDAGGTYYGKAEGCLDFSKIERRPIATFKEQFDKLRKVDKYSDLDPATTGPAMLEAFSKWEEAHKTDLEMIESENQFFGFDNNSVSSLERFTKFVYIPAVMNESHLEDSKSSPIAELTDILARHKLKEDIEIKKLQEDIKLKFAEKLKPFNLSEMADLSKGISSALNTYYNDVNVSIRLDEEQNEIMLPVPKAIIKIQENGYETGLTSTGQGLQRAFILSLLQYFAENEAINGSSSEELNLILGIDEPELYQHPSKQKLFYSILKNLSSNGSALATNVQCCYTTHSPLMLNIEEFDRIIRVFKESPKPGYASMTKVCKSSLVALAAKEATLPSRGKPFTTLKILSGMINTIDSRINEGFFSKTVVLVEGASDVVALKSAAKFHSSGAFDLDVLDISIIACGGKTNLEKPKIIFDVLEIPTYIIWDSDYRLQEELEKLIDEETKALPADKARATEKRQAKEAAIKANIDKNKDLLSLGEQALSDWPAHISIKSASFKDNIETLLKEELGVDYLTGLVKKHNAVIGAKGAWKNPLVMNSVLDEAFSNNKRSPTLERIISQILTLNSTNVENDNVVAISKAA